SMAYEVPFRSHGAVASEMICSWNNQLYGAYQEDLIVGSNSYYTADPNIRPLDLSHLQLARNLTQHIQHWLSKLPTASLF
ncbi:9529_t:CDS:1, partial [Diversispora eburnea]